MKKKTSLRRFIIGLLVGLICLIWVLPICYGILSSLKSEIEIKDLNFHFIPQTWTLENYKYVLTSTGNTPVLKWLVNSLVISTVSAAGSVILLSLAAYGYTRIEWKGRDKVFYCMLALSFFPQIVNIIPLYQIVNMFGWVNKMAAVIVPSLAGVTNMFLMRQFMLGIPKNFDEAARIDGAGEFTIYSRVIMPMMKPVVTVVVLFTFTSQWNDLLWPSIVFNDVQKMPLTPGLQLLMGAYGNFYLASILTAAVVSIIPTFLLYIFAQKYFLQSLSLSSGVKG
ncbi:carbohydrate ABC transporter permease [Muricomes sp. OA1]|uniref:Carbohydrate ABC transporter permease n=1 Tax=Hungatella hathewayi TaxID=154046 RepID=A0A3E2WNX2_9FIRM|nr:MULTISPECIES: carbohydrate ABC transporter permease [Clostridia]MCH1970935.1 carbohydrate ABC transporter permease [Muricomes sp. OA1]MEE0199853.1 carbohydrate ABC transporter permease [Muricomes sp.]RGC28290.1 carbohydrate ABC transporter permease [Hungatella hathewayi]GKH34282.1 sugar ABC transporter permease [Faecalicatena contorta]